MNRLRLPDWKIVFDGGSKGNPGRGYGSFAIRPSYSTSWNISRIKFTGLLTSNEAEYDTLIAALEFLSSNLKNSGNIPKNVSIEIKGDSQLVIKQLSGIWKTRNARLIPRKEKAQYLISQFGKATLIAQPRSESLRLLGH